MKVTIFLSTLLPVGSTSVLLAAYSAPYGFEGFRRLFLFSPSVFLPTLQPWENSA